MAVEKYINDILNSPTYVFDQIVDKIIGNNIKHAKIELKRQSTDVDVVLFEAIKSVLKDLKEEEGFFSRVLYNKFGIELRKNKRREQLIYLGSQLKTQHAKVKSELFRLYRQKERISLSIVDLKRLSDGFKGKKFYFKDKKMLNKSKFYMTEIGMKIEGLKECEVFLASKHNSLGDTEKMYDSMLKKIPRYHELQEENHLLLISSRKKK
jgi:hypothetical protein